MKLLVHSSWYSLLLNCLPIGIMASVELLEPKVAIIGGGVSGLAIAKDLSQLYGFTDITIFEANDRLGGRMHTVHFGDSTVELGAQFFHATGSEVYEIAKRNDLTLSRAEIVRWRKDKAAILKEDGQAINERISVSFYTAMFEEPAERYLLQNAAQFNNLSEAMTSLFDLWKARNVRRWTRLEKDYSIDSLFSLVEAIATADDGGPDWEKISVQASNLWEDYPRYLVDPVKSPGYSRIIEIIRDSLPDTTKIQLSTEIVNIDYRDPANIVLKTIDDNEMEFKHVFCTVPIGYLKHNHYTLFTPQLGQMYTEAMMGIGAGSVEKVFALFAEQIWDDSSLISHDFLWNQTEDVTRENLERLFMSASQVEGIPRALIFWMSGKGVEVYLDATDEEIKDAIHQALATFFPLKDESLLRPEQILRTAWSRDPFTLGSYSHPTTDFDRTGLGAATLASNPIKNSQGRPALMFAGEATEETAFGSVHGAYFAGSREAQRLAASYDRA